MPEALLPLALQIQASPMYSSALRSFIITSIFLAFVITAAIFIFRYFRVQRNSSASEKLREEFDKSKEALLAAAMVKKQAAEAAESGAREVSADEQERESLRESIDPQRVIGQDCPICGLELMADEELVIDPYTGTGYHLSSFLNDWPLDPETHQPLPRPKFVYRYPQGTVVHSSELVYTF